MDSRKLLIVDDDAHIRRLLKIHLRTSGYELFEAANGEEALELQEANHFDVILLDLILPYYGGFRLCQKLKQGDPAGKPRIVIMTGDDSPETRATARECGAAEFLAKPFEASKVRDLVATVAAT